MKAAETPMKVMSMSISALSGVSPLSPRGVATAASTQPPTKPAVSNHAPEPNAGHDHDGDDHAKLPPGGVTTTALAQAAYNQNSAKA